uniref:Wd40 repeat-containing protein n=1 Tax=Tetraselmis sp. GSL018 TaxID=582737 RepID=A0A061QNP5_9CHLO|eukprot:CAMPEP_0177625252 /NCGR_PEP_ID=MMETSP0419_2-20121207/29985_1 /TAXON_ID=582737 /ORGANISM="Tetraselmis sp., Strain GSL018" /LENGTH=1187 /DNA_ID=CAMNT_0019126155 /DNA_START=45 /DNA_END=3608 /DNA_ORIENTATION=+
MARGISRLFSGQTVTNTDVELSVALDEPVNLQAFVESNHWRPGYEHLFVDFETRLREVNRFLARSQRGHNSEVETDLFISHSQRNEHTQQRKRRLVTELSRLREGGKRPGFTYWADFLDLSGAGPVPWRREIEEGILKSAKFVAFIDIGFLRSYNCLVELALAFLANKPVVPIILDEEAWRILTSPNSVDELWTSPELQGFEGNRFSDDIIFSRDLVQDLIRKLSNINLCAFRPSDVATWGEGIMLTKFRKDVEKDMPYLKEWTELKENALRWLGKAKATSALLAKDEVERWSLWCSQAVKYAAEPQPTPLQLEFVRASETACRQRRFLIAGMWLFILLITTAAAIASGIMASMAHEEAARANEAKQVAQEQTDITGRALSRALESERVAVEKTSLAERNMRVAAVLLLAADKEPASPRAVRSMLKACDTALLIDRQELVMPQLISAVTHLGAQRFWEYDLDGHDAAIRDVAFTADGTYLASGGEDSTVRVWELRFQPGKSLLPSVPAPTELTCAAGKWVYSVSFSHDGLLLAAGTTESSTACVWERLSTTKNSWTLKRRFQVDPSGSDSFDLVSFSPHSMALVAGLSNGKVFLWDFADADNVTERVLLEPFADKDKWVPRAAAWLPDEKHLLMGGTKNHVRILDLDAGGQVDKFLVGEDINEFALKKLDAPDEYLLVTAVDLQAGFLWHLSRDANGTWAMDLLQRLGGDIDGHSAVWSPGGSTLALAAGGTTLFALSSDAGAEPDPPLSAELVMVPEKNSPRSLAWSERAVAVPGSAIPEMVVTIAEGTEGTLIRMRQSSVRLELEGPVRVRPDCATESLHEVRGAAISQDGTMLATSAFLGSVCVWRRSGKEWRNTDIFFNSGDSSEDVTDKRVARRVLAWAPSGEKLACVADDGTLSVMSVTPSSSQVLYTVQAFNHSVRSLAWSQDSRYLACGGLSREPFVLVLDADEPDNRSMLKGHKDRLRWLSWKGSPDTGGALLVSSSNDNTVSLWQILKGVDGALWHLHLHSIDLAGEDISAVEWSPAGDLVAALNDGTLRILTVADGTLAPALTISGHTAAIRSLAWSPDARMIVSCGRDDSVRYWELTEDHRELRRTWKVDMPCKWMQWIPAEDGGVDRLAVLRLIHDAIPTSYLDPDKPAVIELDFAPVWFQDWYHLLRMMTYGELDMRDLNVMGYSDLSNLVVE